MPSEYEYVLIIKEGDKVRHKIVQTELERDLIKKKIEAHGGEVEFERRKKKYT